MGKKKKTRKEKYATVYPIVSHWSQFMRWFLLVAIIGMIVLGYLFYTTNPVHRYWQIADVLMSSILTVFLLSCILALFGLKKYTITEETITISDYWHRKIRVLNRDELLGHFETVHLDKNENTSGKTLVITTAGRPIKISSYYYNNYSEIKHELIKGLKIDKDAEDKSTKRWVIRLGIIVFLFSIVLLSISYSDFNSPPLSRDSFTFVNGTISKIEYDVSSSNKGRTKNHSIKLRLNEEPEFLFKMGDKVWSGASLRQAVSYFNTGDSISIAVLNQTFNKKITKTDSLDFWDKHNHYHHISFAAIYKGNEIILPLKTYIEEENKPADFGDYIGLGFGLVVLIFGLILIIVPIYQDFGK